MKMFFFFQMSVISDMLLNHLLVLIVKGQLLPTMMEKNMKLINFVLTKVQT